MINERAKIVLLLAFALAFAASSMSVIAATFNCSIRTSCNAGEVVLIGLNSSEAGLAPNDSHAYLANYSVTQPYVVCCWTDAFRTINNSCIGNGQRVLGVADTNNTHVQQGNYTTYQYSACLNVTSGNVSCQFSDNSCGAGFSPVVSIASSEPTAMNQTNDHVGSFLEYTRKVCCQVGAQHPPVLDYVNISPNGTTTTRIDLECQNGSWSDADGDSVSFAYNWYRNGTSIEILNLPMDYDSGTGMTHDVSGYGNSPTTLNATFSPTGGYVGGAFTYNSLLSQEISFPVSPSLNMSSPMNNFSVSFWFYIVSTPDGSGLVSKDSGGGAFNGGGLGWDFRFRNVPSVEFAFNNGTGSNPRTSAFVGYNAWHHIVGVIDRTGATQTIYADGQLAATISIAGMNGLYTDSYPLEIGKANAYLNGTVDEVIIFNRTLSASEVKTLYQTNNRWFNSTELKRSEGWNCSITPIDSTGLNGTTKYSNMTKVNGSAPLAPNLTYPLNNNQTVFERFLNFTWNASDERDGDTINYTFYLTPTGTCTNGVPSASNIFTTNYTYGELCTDLYYNWTARACDVDGCSANTTTWNFTVQSVVSFKILQNASLGVFNRNQTKTTDTNASLTPIIINNTGNVRLNISANGSTPFSTLDLPTIDFMYKANTTNISSSVNFDTAGSQMTYLQINNQTLQSLIKRLNYTDQLNRQDSTAAIDFNITSAINEPPGNKQSNLTISAVSG